MTRSLIHAFFQFVVMVILLRRMGGKAMRWSKILLISLVASAVFIAMDVLLTRFAIINRIAEWVRTGHF